MDEVERQMQDGGLNGWNHMKNMRNAVKNKTGPNIQKEIDKITDEVVEAKGELTILCKELDLDLQEISKDAENNENFENTVVKALNNAVEKTNKLKKVLQITKNIKDKKTKIGTLIKKQILIDDEATARQKKEEDKEEKRKAKKVETQAKTNDIAEKVKKRMESLNLNM